MADSEDLLFELGTEELPPTALLTLRDSLRAQVTDRLDQAGLQHGEINAFAAPRRLALLIRSLDAKQADKSIEKRGPAVAAAYNPDGSPSKAAEGFARSCSTSVDQLDILKTDKGEWLCFKQHVKGAATAELIPEIITRSLGALPIAKRMRWGTLSAEFVRPVHWIVLLYGDETIQAEILGIKAGRQSHGHRFHHNEPISIANASEYPDLLVSKGKVLPNFEQRKQSVRRQAIEAAQAVKGEAHIEEDLLDEITALVEWPVAVTGQFEERFLELPPEVLITTMQSNQKYFPVKGPNGKLTRYFITISNIESKKPDTVRQGNERVIRPRLADAEFFWQQDRKDTLESRIVSLAGIIFQKTLGTLADKAHRVEHLAKNIAEQLGVESSAAAHAALLAKSDLLTDMVGEFPGLQGTMGRYYALADGEKDEVAAAIEEQYLPKQAGGSLPETRTGQILALAEKIDTVVGIFSAGLVPSGDKDPYALRRAALGALRIIIEKKLTLDLWLLIEFSSGLFNHEFDRDALKRTVFEFFLDRLKGYCLDKGYKPDEFEAVISVRPTQPLDFDTRLKAVKEFRLLPEAESLAGANKRIRNILRKSETTPTQPVNYELCLGEPQEIALLQSCQEAVTDIGPLLDCGDYTSALTRLARLRDSVDAFFDHVMVMADDDALRRNRLGLLTLIETLFLRIADISKLQ